MPGLSITDGKDIGQLIIVKYPLVLKRRVFWTVQIGTKKADKWVPGHLMSDTHLFADDTLRLGDGLTMPLSADDVYGDMSEIVTGAKPGRQNEQERIVYTHAGTGIHDIAIAKVAYTRAKEQGIGTRVRLI